MKNLIAVLALLVSVNVDCCLGSTNVTVHLGQVSVLGTRTNMWFECNVTINNQTPLPLTVTNLFVKSPGLALKVSDLEGNELKRVYAWPIKTWTWTQAPGSQEEFKRLGYGAKPGPGGTVRGI